MNFFVESLIKNRLCKTEKSLPPSENETLEPPCLVFDLGRYHALENTKL